MGADHTAVRTGNITAAQVRAVLEMIAATYPNRRDQRAVVPRYVADGRPDCLVALALQRLGFSLSMLCALDREHPTGDILHAGVRVAESRHPALARFDPRAIALLDHIQQHQHKGHTWRAVVASASRRSRFLPGRLARRRKPWLYPTEEI